ncbi:MAG: adenylate/guanylate cyclase domain-containing protein, partial [Christensenellales bacterium]
MGLTQYLVIFSAITIVFVVLMFCLLFGRFNKKVLKKSTIEGRVYIYIMVLSAILFVATIVYVLNLAKLDWTSYLVLNLMFVTYAISVMLSLLVIFKPLEKINKTAMELAKGKKNLLFDFEGAMEFESISDSLNEIQNNYKLNDKNLNKKEFEYQKFLPKEYLKYFGKTKLEDVKVGNSVQVKLCTMFCDLRSSYFSSETLSLADNFVLIKEFVDEVTRLVHTHKGFVDKYMGDGILAVFDNEDDALKSANEIAKHIDYKNIVSVGKEAINYGISLNSGMCVVGVVGEEKQKQFVVVSDVVNLCSRVENLNKIFHTRVLMTKQFMSNLKDAYNFKYVGTIEFDDTTSKVPIFESLDAYEDAKRLLLQKTIGDFESGVRLYEQGEFEKAKQYFVGCIKINQNDALSKLYLSKT